MTLVTRRSILALLTLSPIAAGAQTTPLFAPVAARDVTEADHLYLHRPVIVFADTPTDPDFLRQMSLLERHHADLAARDVILITDTDPVPPSALRRRLHPRGFSLVLMDKDWKVALRKPLPWDGREVVNSIDKMPMTRAEALEKNPAGR